jgi:DNA/RNA endonuclease G (NUC1)
MKFISIFTLISLISISAFWYLEVATPYQQEFTKSKAKEYGAALAEKGKEASSVIAKKTKEIYKNRDEYINKAKEISHVISEKAKDVAEAIKNQPSSVSLNTSNYQSAHFFGGQPVSTTYPNPIKIIKNEGFIVGYDEKRMNPAWVAYRIFKDDIETGPKRPSRFSIDKRTSAKVSHNDYTNSGYDRGHMAPNYAIALRYGVDAQKETFLMSNIVPQSPALNQGPWRELEEDVAREYGNSCGEVWVICSMASS